MNNQYCWPYGESVHYIAFHNIKGLFIIRRRYGGEELGPFSTREVNVIFVLKMLELTEKG